MGMKKLSIELNKSELLRRALVYKMHFEHKAHQLRQVQYQVRIMRNKFHRIRKEIDYLLKHPWGYSENERKWK